MSAPAVLHVPPGTLGSYEDEVAEVMEMAGRPLDPHQRVAVDALTAYTTGGKWPTFVAGVEGPRQTVGKTGGILLPIALTLSLMFDPDERTWTAHRLDTTGKTFRDARRLLGVDDQDRAKWRGELSLRVKNVSYENGNEHIEFMNDALLWFKARSGRSGRGLSGNDVFADELLFADDAQLGAQLPTMATRSAKGSPRLWTASSSAKAESTFLRRLRARAVAGDRGVVYVGWWARGSWADPPCERGIRCGHLPGTPGCALDDPVLRAEANPGLGVRTAAAFLDEMRGTLSPLEFGREFFGWQELGDDDADTIPLDRWGERVDEQSRVEPGARPVYSVDVSPDRRTTSIGVAGRRDGGGVHLGLVEHRSGTDWVVGRLRQLAVRHDPAAIVLDGASPAAALLPSLMKPEPDGPGWTVRSDSDPGGLLVVTTATEMGRACGGLLDAVEASEPDVWHRGSELVEAALRSAARRPLGDGLWGFGRKASGGDITAAVVMALAHYGQAVHGDADYDLSDSFA